MNLYAAIETRLGRLPALVGSLMAVVLVVGCTEKLAIPGDCPTLCPGGQAVVVDTVLEAIVGGDSSFTGYGLLNDGVTIQLANGGDMGEVVGLVRFVPGSDSVMVADTFYTVTRDSVRVQFYLFKRDPAASGVAIDFYRLSPRTDSLVSQEEVLAAMTPDRLLRSVPVPDDTENGVVELLFETADLGLLPFVPSDSGRLVIGARLRANQPGVGAYLGGASSGSGAPIWHTYGHIDIADTSLVSQSVTRAVQWQRSVYSAAAEAHNPDILRIGGPSASRAIIRFALPPVLKDSATILRATLEMVPAFASTGITGDSVSIGAMGLLADFGAKSPVINSPMGSAFARTGTDTVRVDIAAVVALWQGDQGVPSAVRVQALQEYSSLVSPRFQSSRLAGGGPRLRITYRRQFPFGGY
jgi:hypothetical protein